MIGLLALIGLAVVIVAFNLVDRARDAVTGDPAVTAPDAATGDPQPVVTIVTVADGPDGPEAVSIALLASERDSGRGTILLVPTATITDVPGHGSFRLREAFDFGGGPLVGVSVDNLLGIRSDAVVTVTEDGWSTLLDRLGGVEVTLSAPLVDRDADGGGTTLLPAGTQRLDGAGLATLLTHRDDAESELAQLPRVQAALTAVLDRLLEAPDQLDALFADGAPELTVTGTVATGEADTEDVDAGLVRTVLAELATARADDQVTTLTLYVSPLGTGTEDAYRANAERVATLVDDHLAASKPDPGVAGGRSLQVLNGNGMPGVGALVAEVLQPAGYRVLLTGNADRFDHRITRILVYDEEPETLAAARDVRDRLGVGEIERSGTPQSVVDLTIVVGLDFPVGGAEASDEVPELDPGDLDDDG
ncbi:LCP family protein [Nitriliruptor alkaliphilus]|uniref:LCP family protein n=1 Tax=Nitriliruptor alkaliphilus TaxID=427918 RepID=UPI00069888B0|nr:LCP family protein [Nitriliruptor alkaliphilus]